MFRLVMTTKTFLRIAAALAALLLASSPALAQTTGKIRVTVVDEDDFELPQADVTLTGDSLIGGSQSKQTDGAGQAVFDNLPPGKYDILVARGGFRPISMKDVEVNINRTTNQKIRLLAGEEIGELVVEAERQVVDTESTTIGQVITKDFLDRVPTGRSYQQAVQMTSGVVDNGGGNPNMGGGAYNENTYLLDGAEITDPVTGTFSTNFNYDALQQIEVMLGGYEAEYGTSLGGVVNLTTRSGSNSLEFDTSFYYTNGNWFPKTDERVTSDGYTLAVTDFDSTYQLFQASALVSGPIVRDKAWFVFSYQYDRSLIALAGIPQPRDYSGHYLYGKLTVQPTAEHQISLVMQTDPTTIDNGYQGDPYVEPESQTRQAQGGLIVNARWQWFLSEAATLDTRFVYQGSALNNGNVPCTHNYDVPRHRCRPDETEGYNDWYTPGRIGQGGAWDSVSAGNFSLDNRDRYQGSMKLGFVGLRDGANGEHDVKVGVVAEQSVHRRRFGFMGNVLFVDMNESTFNPSSFTNQLWQEASNALSTRTTASKVSAFVQDAYKPVDNLTIKFGLRFDSSTLRNDIGEPAVQGNVFAPRFHVAWDPFGDNKTKIAGGYGRYNSTGILAISGYTNLSSFGYKLYYGEFYKLFSASGSFPPSMGYFGGQSVLGAYTPRDNPSTVADKVRMPYNDEFIFIFQREIVRDFSIGGNFTAKLTRYNFEPDETSLIYAEDGSQIIGSRAANPFVNYTRLRSLKQAKRDYYQVDVVLTKIQSKRWAAQAAYTYSYQRGTSSQANSGSFLVAPQIQYNNGRINNTLEHVVKVSGFWQLPTDPWEQTIGIFMQYYSGAQYERLYAGDSGGIRIRDRGFYTVQGDRFELNLSFSQAFDVRKGKIEVSAQLFNAFNLRAPVSYSSLLYTQNRLFTVGRQDPLRLMLGIKYKF